MPAPGTTATGIKMFIHSQIIDLSLLRYDEDEARVNRDNQKKIRSALQRYLFCIR
jgi:hypothetical protein